MKSGLWIAVGVVLVLVGAIWTSQGLGYLAGSSMTGVKMWAVIGPVVAIAGLAALGWGVRGARAR
ncbi:MAG TPA: hypothetical protein VGI84_06190 [Pseudonocardiaceae bacterium]